MKVYLIWYLALVAIWPLLVLALDFIRRNMPTKRVEAILNSVAENSIFAGTALILGSGAFWVWHQSYDWRQTFVGALSLIGGLLLSSIVNEQYGGKDASHH